MKKNILTLFIFLLISSKFVGQTKKDYFTLEGIIRTNYSGYIYLSYNNKKDSCLVINNKFHFKGKMPIADVGYFTTSKLTSMEKDFYLENANIKIDISIETKIIKDFKIDFIKINSISGTKTSLIEKDYEDFVAKHQNDKDWQMKQYKKLDEIVSKYPNHNLTGDLLTGVSWDSLADVKKLQYFYNKLDLKSQRPSTMLVFKKNIYPSESSKVGKPMVDFVLPDKNGKYINTNQYRGSVLLIDFWASWCAPCRKQIPEITKIYEKFKDKNFKILSISLDKNKEKWLLALEKEKMQWDNVLEDKEFLSEIVKEYEVNAIPTSFLINEKGVILANNPTMQELENYLNKL
ncbi:TlpA disulfide reductase family protein [Flavobacterium sp. GT3R68]|uniref:TlpA disulfide reductase family protein n=1 Tax=Flavobacterium sp. GT3R68 TaxID=2594437 RepID=UPI000F87CFDB|nr:TlpA disulfide reductase family protein [Flavobacterium sp. GT3R68]RTY89343.1 AhpC/TSA family protein [Flavobacterium sp. GSN2]TRW93903.1 AhpC/TSA family protein [Flavobacterium sp. GT3R68]